jgi:hypothetical protein
LLENEYAELVTNLISISTCAATLRLHIHSARLTGVVDVNPGEGVIENKLDWHCIDKPRMRVFMSTHPAVKLCFDVGRVLVLNDPPACANWRQGSLAVLGVATFAVGTDA